jgi:hypothetical protein
MQTPPGWPSHAVQVGFSPRDHFRRQSTSGSPAGSCQGTNHFRSDLAEIAQREIETADISIMSYNST